MENAIFDTLDSMCDLIVDCPHSTPKWTDSGYVVLRNQNIKNGFLDLSTPSFTNKDGYLNRIKRAIPEDGDLVFTREAPMGEVCRIPQDLKCCLGQRQVLLRPKERLNGAYLFWALQSPYVQHQISWNEGTGSTVSNVRIPVLKALSIPRFPGKEDIIAKTLSDLHEKIHINTQINQTLEQIAQALFKSWFVDFEPVKAKMAVLESGGTAEKAERAAMRGISGRDEAALEAFKKENPEGYAELAETAALFPAAMVESELGLIPEGWKVGCVGDDYNVTMGQSPKGTSYNEKEEGTLFFQGRAEFGWRYPKPRLYTTEPKRMATGGDVLMSVRAPVGDLNIALADCCIGRGLAALKCKNGGTTYSYYHLKYLQRHFERFNAEGTVFGSINQKDLKSIKIVAPDEQVIRRFLHSVGNIDKKIKLHCQESGCLENIRDTLLPKLLSGELSIKEES